MTEVNVILLVSNIAAFAAILLILKMKRNKKTNAKKKHEDEMVAYQAKLDAMVRGDWKGE